MPSVLSQMTEFGLSLLQFKRIEDRNGNLIDEFLPNTREVLSEGVAYMMSDMLQDVINGGTASTVRNFFS